MVFFWQQEKTMKKCSHCKQEKKENEFSKSSHSCKACYKKQYFNRSARTCPYCKTKYVGKRNYCSCRCKLLANTTKKKNGCWEWRGYQAKHGYCPTKDYDNPGKNIPVHRLAYRVFKGKFAEELLVCHSCDNRKCCNPEHLWLGNHKENAIDASKKGRLRTVGNLGIRNGHAKLNDDKVKEIRKLLQAGKKHKEISEIYGISCSVISEIRNGKMWKHVHL